MTIEVSVDKFSGEFHLQAAFRAHGMILLRGENGSGKTFLLKTIAGLTDGDSGTVKVNGKDVSSAPPWRRSIAYLSQNSFFRHMSVESHLAFSNPRAGADAQYVDTLCSLLSIDRKKKLIELSQGQRMRVSIATAILSGSQVILLDEVLSNLSDAGGVISALSEISEERNIDFIMVFHGIDSLMKSMALEISHGKLITGP